MPKHIQLNENGRRINEPHPRAKLTDHEVAGFDAVQTCEKRSACDATSGAATARTVREPASLRRRSDAYLDRVPGCTLAYMANHTKLTPEKGASSGRAGAETEYGLSGGGVGSARSIWRGGETDPAQAGFLGGATVGHRLGPAKA
jgi:hypothetical protein